MKPLPDHRGMETDAMVELRLDRRGFLVGMGAVLCGLTLFVPGGSAPLRIRGIRESRRAMFQQMPYFNFSGTGESYTPPRGNQATRDYLAGLSPEAFLRRHWFG